MAAMPENAMMSSDIGNNCAIGNAYPSFEEGRKYLAPGLFGPCGYGLPSILGAKIARPDVPAIGFAGDGAFGIAMNEMTACGRNDWPAITMIIFRNYQWGAEKRNTTLWYDDNFVGTELNVCLRPQGHQGGNHGRPHRGAENRRQGTAGRQRHDVYRSRAEPGTGRAFPPRRDEGTGCRGRHLRR
jgi:hypothetical protein